MTYLTKAQMLEFLYYCKNRLIAILDERDSRFSQYNLCVLACDYADIKSDAEDLKMYEVLSKRYKYELSSYYERLYGSWPKQGHYWWNYRNTQDSYQYGAKQRLEFICDFIDYLEGRKRFKIFNRISNFVLKYFWKWKAN